jgi:hypothetical protein
MFCKRAWWYAGSILGAAGVGALFGLAYFSQAFSQRLSVAMVSAVAVFLASAFLIFAIFRTAIRIGFFPILAVAGGLGGLVFSLIARSSLPWSIFLGCVIGLAAPCLFLLTRKTFHSAGTKEPG